MQNRASRQPRTPQTTPLQPWQPSETDHLACVPFWLRLGPAKSSVPSFVRPIFEIPSTTLTNVLLLRTVVVVRPTAVLPTQIPSHWSIAGWACAIFQLLAFSDSPS